VASVQETWRDCYRTSTSLAQATRKLVHLLFGKYGLLVMDASTPACKAFLAPVIAKELATGFSEPLVKARTETLEAKGFEAQIHGRDINLFYMVPGTRSRIVNEGDEYIVLNTDLRFSQQEILAIAASKPERFSPNVVLRPVYQELLLPNLSYTGGPAEIAYWLQLGGVFQELELPFPLLIPRHFAMLVTSQTKERMGKNELSYDTLIQGEKAITQHIVTADDTESPQEWSTLYDQLQAIYTQASAWATTYDSTLEGKVGAELAKVKSGLENLEKRTQKAHTDRHAVAIGRAMKVYESLFPNQGLQERKSNIIPFLAQSPTLIDMLVKGIDPFDYRFHIWEL
jgi:bacillithiol synthase